MFIFYTQQNKITYPGDDCHNDDPNAPTSEHKMITMEQFRSSANALNRYELDDSQRMVIYQNKEWFGHPPLGRVALDEINMLKK